MKFIALILPLLTFSTFAIAADSAQEFVSDLGIDFNQLPENYRSQIAHDIQALEQTEPTRKEVRFDPRDEVSEGELRLAGRGFVDRKTGDSLALAFYTRPSADAKKTDCPRLRHVYFEHASKKAYYVGSETILSCQGEASTEEIKTAAKEVSRGFKKFRREKNHNKNVYMSVGFGVAVWPTALWFLSPSSWFVVGASGLFPAFGIYWGGILVWCVVTAIYQGNEVFMASSSGSQQVLIDRDGWNWSSRPKKIRHRTFELYSGFIGVPSPVQAE